VRSILLIAVLVQACWHSSADEQHWFDSLHDEWLGAGASRSFNANAAMTLQAAEDALPAAGLYPMRTCPAPTSTDLKPACGGPEVANMGLDTLVFYAFPDRPRGWDGRQVRVVVAGRGPQESIVYVVSKRGMKTVTHGSGDYSSVIFNAISGELDRHTTR
jgi:hypothetical protein